MTDARVTPRSETAHVTARHHATAFGIPEAEIAAG
jgi:hypothetical protein